MNELARVPDDFSEEDYLICNPDVADAVQNNHMSSGAFHWSNYGRHEVRRIRTLRHKSESKEVKNKTVVGLSVPAGLTRNCLDPWGYIQVKANGEVLPCCAHPPIGRVTEVVSLPEVLNGSRIDYLRKGILSGNLNKYCSQCAIKEPSTLLEHRKHFARHQLSIVDLSRSEDGGIILDADNGMPGWLRLYNVDRGQYVVSDAIYLKTVNDRNNPVKIAFENLDWSDERTLDLIASVPPESGAIEVTLMAGPSLEDLAPVKKATVYRGESMNLSAVIPESISGSIITISVQPFFEDESATSIALSYPILMR